MTSPGTSAIVDPLSTPPWFAFKLVITPETLDRSGVGTPPHPQQGADSGNYG